MKREPLQNTVLLIAGMRDNHCRERVAAALENVVGVRRVDVNLYRASATVEHDRRCGEAEFLRATLDSGHTASLAQKDRRDEPRGAAPTTAGRGHSASQGDAG